MNATSAIKSLRRLVGFISRYRTQDSISLRQIRTIIGKPAPVIIEIGAADGLDTLRLLEAFPDPFFRIYCIEPDPRNTASFRQRVRDPRAELFDAAVGATDGTSLLHQSSTIYSSSLKEPNLPVLNATWPEISFPEAIPVRTITLDSFIRDRSLSLVDFIWADVQGAEDLLISGGRESLTNHVRYFYTEYNRVPYYEAAPCLRTIRKLLGPDWKLIRDYGTDALFKNHRLP
jgi:FkbM family methyltransferase